MEFNQFYDGVNSLIVDAFKDCKCVSPTLFILVSNGMVVPIVVQDISKTDQIVIEMQKNMSVDNLNIDASIFTCEIYMSQDKQEIEIPEVNRVNRIYPKSNQTPGILVYATDRKSGSRSTVVYKYKNVNGQISVNNPEPIDIPSSLLSNDLVSKHIN